MVRTHALMESVSANLQEFLREGLLSLLRAGRPVVTRMARKLPSRRAYRGNKRLQLLAEGLAMKRLAEKALSLRKIAQIQKFFAFWMRLPCLALQV